MVMNRRSSLPPLNEMTTMQVPRSYGVSPADGNVRHSDDGGAPRGGAPCAVRGFCGSRFFAILGKPVRGIMGEL